MRAFGWGADSGGCRWYRLTGPFEALSARGHDVSHAIEYDRGYEGAPVVGMRVATAGPSVRWHQWASAGRRLVYDIDDDYLRLDLTAPNRNFYSASDTQRRIIGNINRATLVTCATERLAAEYRHHNPNVVVVPNGIPERILDWARPERQRPGVTIGWAGTPSTLPDLAPIVGKLKKFLDRHPDVELHTVGIAASALRKIGLRHAQLKVTGYIDGTEAYLKHISRTFDAWVAPYRSTPFNECKVPTKALEAAALSIPIIASDITPYRGHIRDGETGILIRRDHEWDRALRDLVNDTDQRDRMGAAAREQAADHTTERIAPLWEQAIWGAA